MVVLAEPNRLPLLNFGPDVAKGVLREPREVADRAGYAVLVPSVDADGNDVAGVRVPMVQAPLGTYTGWNPRRRGFGHGAQWRFEGSYIPFPDTESEQAATGDPRVSVRERYGDSSGYVAAIRQAAWGLVEEGLMLREDVERCAAAAEGWDPRRHMVGLG